MKVLVDSSVWIDHLRGVRTRETEILDRLLASLDPELGLYDTEAPADLLIGDLILCKYSAAFRMRASTRRSRRSC